MLLREKKIKNKHSWKTWVTFCAHVCKIVRKNQTTSLKNLPNVHKQAGKSISVCYSSIGLRKLISDIDETSLDADHSLSLYVLIQFSRNSLDSSESAVYRWLAKIVASFFPRSRILSSHCRFLLESKLLSEHSCKYIPNTFFFRSSLIRSVNTYITFKNVHILSITRDILISEINIWTKCTINYVKSVRVSFNTRRDCTFVIYSIFRLRVRYKNVLTKTVQGICKIIGTSSLIVHFNLIWTNAITILIQKQTNWCENIEIHKGMIQL